VFGSAIDWREMSSLDNATLLRVTLGLKWFLIRICDHTCRLGPTPSPVKSAYRNVGMWDLPMDSIRATFRTPVSQELRFLLTSGMRDGQGVPRNMVPVLAKCLV
jgi:hypothetical protein